MSTLETTRHSFLDQFLAGARACLPVAVSVAAYGMVWGVLARGAGLTLLEAAMMSGLVFAGAAQFVAVDLWTATPATLPIGALVLGALIVNIRYLLLTATLRPLYPAKKIGLGAFSMILVSDENWAMTVAEMARGRGTAAFLMGGGALAYISWMTTNLTGYMLGGSIGDPSRWGLDFAFTATFLALLLGMWRGKSDLVPWVVAGGTAIIANRLFGGQWHIVVGALAGSLTGATLQMGKRHADQH